MLLTLLIVGNPVPAVATNARTELPDQLELLEQLRARDFDSLSQTLSHYQRGFESAELAEAGVEAAFLAFASSEPELQNRLDDWVQAAPTDYRARAARGIYHWNLGLLSRGSRRPDTHLQQRQSEMRTRFELAMLDLGMAVSDRPEFGLGYALLIHMITELGSRADVEATFELAMQHAPTSLVVRRRYLDAWRPPHGASATSLEALKQRVAELVTGTPYGSPVRVFAGYADLVRADLLAAAGNREAAATSYERAVHRGDYWLYRYRRALNAFRMERFEEALVDVDRVLLERPQAPRVLNLRARVLTKLGRVDAALSDWELALSLNPFDPIILLHLAYALRDEQRFDEAMRALNRGLELGASNDHIWDARGRILLYDYQWFELAAEALAQAVEIRPSSARHRFNHATALYKAGDCGATTALSYYLELCDNEACPEPNVELVANWKQTIEAGPDCEQDTPVSPVAPQQ